MKNKKSYINNILCIGSVVLLIILLIPLLYIGKYNVMSADDFSYGWRSHLSWEQTRSVKNVISSAIETLSYHYFNWQGTFSAMFLMALSPCVFGEKYYSITPFILIGSLIISILFFVWVIVRKIGKREVSEWLILSNIWLIINTQFLPCPVQAFYWYNGSIYYSFFYSLSLIMYGLVLLYAFGKTKYNKIMLFIMCILGIIIGGGNYVTALISILLIATVIFFAFINKNSKYKFLIIPFLFLLISFSISAFAPGNSVRQSNFDSPGVINSIVLSLYYAISNLFKELISPTFILILIASPLLWKLSEGIKFKFKHPLFFITFGFLLYASQYCPPIYAMNGIGDGRLQNIIFYSSVLFLYFALFYMFGYIRNNINIEKINRVRVFYYKYIMGLLLIMFMLTLFLYSFSPFSTTATSWYAIDEIKNGSAKEYYTEYTERLKILDNKEIKNAEINEYTKKPFLLFCTDAQNNSDDWRNQYMAKWYDKSTIIIKDVN